MSKKFKLFTSNEDPYSPAQTDWSLCILCQKNTKETLTCPANSGNTSLRGYETHAANLICFHDLKALPNRINILNLDKCSDGDGGAIGLTESPAALKKLDVLWT